MTAALPKRLIEVDLPIKRISAHARREKDMRRGHVPLLYIWPATRPTAACRAVLCAALWPDPADENCPASFREEARKLMLFWSTDRLHLLGPETYEYFVNVQKHPDVLANDLSVRAALFHFIADFSNADNATNSEFVETAQRLTSIASGALSTVQGGKPLVFDPFAGGGAIPLESLRVGADAYASDLNPVAVLLNKVILEFIPKYGSRLSDDVDKWVVWAQEEAQKELRRYYPDDSTGAVPIAYLSARWVICEGPRCGAEVPLLRGLWLARKGSSAALRLVPRLSEKVVDVEVVQNPKARDVGQGTVRRGSVNCPICGYTTPVDSVRKQLRSRRGGSADARLYCVVTTDPCQQGRSYRAPNERDFAATRAAATELERRASDIRGNLALVPDEPLPPQGTLGFRVQLYGMRTWGDLFTPRQALALTTYARLAREYPALKSSKDSGYRNALAGILALMVNRLADLNASLCVWQLSTPNTAHVFGRWALPMIMDFGEVNPLAGAGGSPESALRRMKAGIEAIASIIHDSGSAEAASAVKVPLPDLSAAAFITDPPYYDAVPYADLSDFFYVWLKRTLPESFPISFAEQLSPKSLECIVDPTKGKDRAYFEGTIKLAMIEAKRVLAPHGIGLLVFAHKSTAGWEAQLQAMIDAGWTITASWPIDTEMASRLRAKNSAALASSIHIVCRPREHLGAQNGTVGDWRDVLQALPNRMAEWMRRLAEEGVVGADAIFACLGPALEIFSRYSRVEKANGDTVGLKEYLVYVWAAIAKEALAMVFKGADASGFEEDARLTAMWLWTLSAGQTGNRDSDDDESSEEEESDAVAPSGYVLEYDAARKIAQGLGAHLESLTSLIEVKGEVARLLPVAERTRRLFGKDEAESPTTKRKKRTSQLQLGFVAELEQAEEGGSWGSKGAPTHGATFLDRVHQCMILFAAGRGEALRRFLVDEGVGRDERFWRLAQVLSFLYPKTSDEKRWIDGVLARKKGLGF
jgi:putative DNA methylase